MKHASVIATVIVLVSFSVFAAGGHDHDKDHVPRHGGMVAEVNEVDYELVATRTLLQLSLRDHGKSVAVTGGAARVTLLSGKERIETALLPAVEKFEVQGHFKIIPGMKFVAVVALPGRGEATVWFRLR